MTLLSRNLFIQLRIFKLANVASVYGTKNVPEKSQPTAVSEDLSFSPNIAGGSHQPLPLQGLKCKYFNLPQSHLLHLIWSLGFMWSIFCRQCYLLPSGPLHFISFNDRHYIPLRDTKRVWVHDLHASACVFLCELWLSGTSDRCGRKSLFIFPQAAIQTCVYGAFPGLECSFSADPG